MTSVWKGTSENDKHIKWTRDFFADMQKFASGAYVNFLGEEGTDRIKEAYGEEKYKQLVAPKNKYEPTNFFHLNQKFKPTKL